MIEADQYCVDVLKQTYAIRRAIEKTDAKMLDGHRRHCVIEGIQRGDADVIDELAELYELANK
jgi:DNA-binding FrmR family transcriptional regulator